MLREINFDGIVGPTHNYAGLSEGNLASARNRDTVSRPRDAALQGLRVLLIDGHAAARESLTNLMRPWGIRLEVTNRPAIALENLQSAQEGGDQFRVVLIDSRSLEETGKQIARRIASSLVWLTRCIRFLFGLLPQALS